MASKSKIPWNLVIYAVLGYVAYRALQSSGLLGASTASAAAPTDTFSGPSYVPLTPQGADLNQVVAAYVGQQLQQTGTLNQAVLQKTLANLSSQSSASSAAPLGPAGAAAGVAQLEGITAAYQAAPTQKERLALHPVAQALREQLAASGAGTLVYNPTVGYAQLEYQGKFY